MPTNSDRIRAIKERIARNETKRESLPAMMRLEAAIKADQAKVEKLEIDDAKRKADQRRRDDVRAKIVIGAGVSLLPPAPFTRTIQEVTAVLAKRDREWIENWLKERNIDLAMSATSTDDPVSPLLVHPSDPVGGVLKKAFADLGTGIHELFSAEILGRVPPSTAGSRSSQVTRSADGKNPSEIALRGLNMERSR